MPEIKKKESTGGGGWVSIRYRVDRPHSNWLEQSFLTISLDGWEHDDCKIRKGVFHPSFLILLANFLFLPLPRPPLKSWVTV